MTRKKMTTATIVRRKTSGPKLSVVTAYDSTMATLLDAGGVDILMVGDSLGMVVQGRQNTLAVTLGDMIYHCSAVTRIGPRAHVVCDLPFMSYQVSSDHALSSAGRLVKEGGAESVKLEGGRRVAASVNKIVEAGIPVMGHIGLTPQSVHAFGGFRVQGRTEAAAKELLEDARALCDAGVYSIVVEGVPSQVGELITQGVSVPTIGIGAGSGTDGQVLVCYDLLGMYRGLSPKFVRRFAQLGEATESAIAEYVEAVQDGRFPGSSHSFDMEEGEDLEVVRALAYGSSEQSK